MSEESPSQIIKEVSSLAEYLAVIEGLCDCFKRRGGIPRRLYYRGQANSSYELIPSLARQISGPFNLQFGFERRIIEYVEECFPDAFYNIHTPIDRLAFLQHHGAPTRLLDITASPLVALYFAVEGQMEKDGEVFIFSAIDRDSNRYPMTMAIADSYRMVCGSVEYLETFYDSVKIQDYFLEDKAMAERSVEEMEGGANWVNNCCQQPLFVHSFHHSMRQRIQQSSFILFPNEIAGAEKSKDLHFVERIAPMPKEDKVIAARAIIPSKSKRTILAELERIGINQATLFPDSIEIACKEACRFAKRFE